MGILKIGDWEYVVSEKMNGCIVVRYSGSDASVVVPTTIGGLHVAGIGVGMEMQAIGSVRMRVVSGENIERIVLADSIEIIDDYAFLGCTKLMEVVLPKNLKTIGYGAFYACSTLQSLDIPDGLENIGINAFGECVSLKSVTIPSKTKTVSSFAFAFCKNLESVYIQEGVEFIHEGAFMGTQIKEVILPSTVKIDTISSIGCFDSAVKIKR